MTISPSVFRDDVLSGKRILITGGGTGLGKELARSFISRGAAVYICGRRQNVLDATIAELQQSAAHGGTAKAYICDVREAEQIEAMVDQIIASAPDKVAEVRGGNDKAMNWFTGQVMKLSQGKANPKIVTEIVKKKVIG